MQINTLSRLVGAAAVASCAATASAQYTIDWYTIDGGGGTSTGGVFSLSGTIGQPDAGTMSAGTTTLSGGYWSVAGGPAPCYANCDGSTIAPILNVNDFICFQTKFAQGDPYANCDNSTIAPILNVNDFICFQQKYAAGCP